MTGPALSPSRAAVLGPPLIAVAAFGVHAACWSRYGIFRDEFYFIVCGWRLAWGYVDQPPGIAAVAGAANALFGTWIPGLRLLPWLASAATVFLAGRLALRLGGGPYAAVLASAAALGAPLLLGLGHYLTMNAFEPLLATALVLLLARLASGDDPRLWVLAGAAAAGATLFKYTAALFAAALALGLLATGARRALATRWALVGAVLGALMVLPNLAWQAGHGFPFLELVRNGQVHKNAPLSLPAFAGSLLLEPNPLDAPLWLGGLGWLLLGRGGRPFRWLGVGAAILLALLAATGGKPYYFAVALPALLAAGAVVAERLVRPRAARAALPAAAVAAGLALAPLAIPLLPIEKLAAYQGALGVRQQPLERRSIGAPLPQIHADQFGFGEMADAAIQAYRSLPEAERATAGIFAQNYGQAAAIEVLAAGSGLPRVASGHNNYFIWGLPPGRGDPLLVVGGEDEDCGRVYRERTRALRVAQSPWMMPDERGLSIWVCRGLTQPMRDLWPRVKIYL